MKEKPNKLQSFIFVIFIPTVFAITLMLVVLSVIGVDITSHAKAFGKNVPFLSAFILDEDAEELEAKHRELEQTIKDKDQYIQQLEFENGQQKKDLESLQQEVEMLSQKLDETEHTEQKREEKIKTVTTSFKDMEPEEAANILEKMKEQDILLIMTDLSAKQRGEILAAMDSEKAATIIQTFFQGEEN
ncbi:MotE family protein [Salirhabdus salicampi]|uniref:MotE family protein n=1 Tax=Salirhabdus salicampi TaxID=476102 RepID=UPI0020C420FA|nr:hypothetical protein [Salirhabdus salicampi]MCP8616520.1 hypothetical protein [Salirhabdus salicampi]